jgi:hypothetical protein
MAWLSKRAANLLRRALAGKTDHEREITYAKGGGYWLGDDRVAGRDVMELQRLCLLRLEHGEIGRGYEVYVPSQDSQDVLDGGEPLFIRALREERARRCHGRPR